MIRLLATSLALALVISLAGVDAVHAHTPIPSPEAAISASEGPAGDRRDRDHGDRDHPCSVASCASTIGVSGFDAMAVEEVDPRRDHLPDESLSLFGVILSAEPPVPRAGPNRI